LTKNIKIVVFDFDGTLIKGDSIKLYCKWLSFNSIEFIFNYHIRFRLLKLINSNFDIKHERVKFYFNRQIKMNFNINEFNQILNENLFEDALEVLESYKSDNKLYVVSASFFEIINSFCNNFLKVNLITNNIKDYNTLNDINFKNKIVALDNNIKKKYKITVGYGNSSGDFDFMQISKKAFLRLPNGEYITWKK